MGSDTNAAIELFNELTSLPSGTTINFGDIGRLSKTADMPTILSIAQFFVGNGVPLLQPIFIYNGMFGGELEVSKEVASAAYHNEPITLSDGTVIKKAAHRIFMKFRVASLSEANL